MPCIWRHLALLRCCLTHRLTAAAKRGQRSAVDCMRFHCAARMLRLILARPLFYNSRPRRDHLLQTLPSPVHGLGPSHPRPNCRRLGVCNSFYRRAALVLAVVGLVVLNDAAQLDCPIRCSRIRHQSDIRTYTFKPSARRHSLPAGLTIRLNMYLYLRTSIHARVAMYLSICIPI